MDYSPFAYLGSLIGFLLQLHKPTLSNVADWATIIGVAGVVWVFIDFYLRREDSRRHALITIEKTLEIIATWASYSNEGYPENRRKEIREANAKNWGDPFFGVLRIDASGLQSIWSNPGMILLPDDIISKTASLIQEIASFNSIVDSIDKFKSSIDPTMAVSIHLKLNGLTSASLTFPESIISTKLRESYENLHFAHIGHKTSERLHQKHKELYDLVKAELKRE
jgi:hypothetical protein